MAGYIYVPQSEKHLVQVKVQLQCSKQMCLALHNCLISFMVITMGP
jgi:hypothetical protein